MFELETRNFLNDYPFESGGVMNGHENVIGETQTGYNGSDKQLEKCVKKEKNLRSFFRDSLKAKGKQRSAHSAVSRFYRDQYNRTVHK